MFMIYLSRLLSSADPNEPTVTFGGLRVFYPLDWLRGRSTLS